MKEHSNFYSEEVFRCIPELPWAITEEDFKVRKDLRHLPICSIDSAACRDIDDALHCIKLDNDMYEIGVHIADVSHFIRPETPIDEEAAVRGTAVYIPPKAALSYEKAQNLIDDESRNDEITLSLRLMVKVAKLLKKQRINNGALLLQSPEIETTIETETHDPIDDEKNESNKEIGSVLEEFMLLANVSAGQRIFEEFPECTLLRWHPAPGTVNFQPLIKAGLSKGFQIKIKSEKDLAESLDAAVDTENPYFNPFLRMVATRCVAQTLFISSGVLPVSEYFHYALSVPLYTQFTSPIRRYVDLVVHRLLAAAIGADVAYPSLVDKNKTQEICNLLNHKNAIIAVNNQLFVKKKPVHCFIVYIEENRLKLLMLEFCLVSNLYMNCIQKTEEENIFTYYEEGPTQSAAGVTLRLFDEVTIQLHVDRSDAQHQKTTLKLVKHFIPVQPPMVDALLLATEPTVKDEPPVKKQKTM